MLSISKALNSGQAQTYHQMEFTSSTQSYYKQDGAVAGRMARTARLQDGPVRCSQRQRSLPGSPTANIPRPASRW